MSVDCTYLNGIVRKGQYISKKRPSRFVILRCAQDDNPASASFDSQNVFFEMYCPQGPALSGGQSAPTILRIGLSGSSMVGGLAPTLFSRHIRLCIAIANRVLRRLAFFCCGLCSLRTARSKKPPANYRRVPIYRARAVRSPEELRKGCSWVPLM